MKDRGSACNPLMPDVIAHSLITLLSEKRRERLKSGIDGAYRQEVYGHAVYGVRQMTWHLKGEGHKAYPRSNALWASCRSIKSPLPPNRKRPIKFTLTARRCKVTQADHVWCADITPNIPMRKGFLLWRLWTGPRGVFCRGGSPIQWMLTFALRL